MAFIVEDGTGLANATSYTTLVFADDYFADRGVVRWTENSCDAEQQVALILATDYIDVRYRFRGFQRFPDVQALEWPRDGLLSRTEQIIIDPDTVPIRVQKATAEIALVALDSDIFPNALKEGSEVLAESKGARGLTISRTFKEVVDNTPVLRKALGYLADLRAADELLRS